MNDDQFDALSDTDKLDYVLECLYKAHGFFKAIYDSGCGFQQETLDELEHLGDEFSRIGLMAEERNFSGIYSDLNKNLAKLSSIVSAVSDYVYKNRVLN